MKYKESVMRGGLFKFSPSIHVPSYQKYKPNSTSRKNSLSHHFTNLEFVKSPTLNRLIMRDYNTEQPPPENNILNNTTLSSGKVGNSFQDATQMLRDYIHQEIQFNERELKKFIERENQRLGANIENLQDESAKAKGILKSLTSLIDKHKEEEEAHRNTIITLSKIAIEAKKEARAAMLLLIFLILLALIISSYRMRFIEEILKSTGWYDKRLKEKEKNIAIKVIDAKIAEIDWLYKNSWWWDTNRGGYTKQMQKLNKEKQKLIACLHDDSKNAVECLKDDNIDDQQNILTPPLAPKI